MSTTPEAHTMGRPLTEGMIASDEFSHAGYALKGVDVGSVIGGVAGKDSSPPRRIPLSQGQLVDDIRLNLPHNFPSLGADNEPHNAKQLIQDLAPVREKLAERPRNRRSNAFGIRKRRSQAGGNAT